MTPNSTEENKLFTVYLPAITLVMLVVMLLDNITGFTYRNARNYRIFSLQINNINEQNATVLASNNATIDSLKGEMNSYKSSFDPLAEKIKLLHTSAKQENKRDLWFFLSTSSLYIICAVVFAIFSGASYLRSKKINFTRALLGILTILFIFIALAAGTDYTLAKIPNLGNNWIWNYVLNSFLQLTIIILICVFLFKLGQCNMKRQARSEYSTEKLNLDK